MTAGSARTLRKISLRHGILKLFTRRGQRWNMAASGFHLFPGCARPLKHRNAACFDVSAELLRANASAAGRGAALGVFYSEINFPGFCLSAGFKAQGLGHSA